MGKHLDYAWDKLRKDLTDNQISFEYVKNNTRVTLIKIKELVDFWLKKLHEDKFYLLDDKSKDWIIPQIEKLGRPFILTDFE